MPTNDEGLIDRTYDDIVKHTTPKEQDELGKVGEHMVPFGTTMVREMNQIADDLGTEAELDKKMLDAVEKSVKDQPPSVAAGIDVAPIKAVDPQFDPDNFRIIARETFLKVRDARSSESEAEADPLLSAQMVSELHNEIDGDVSSHRHHLLIYLELEQAQVVAASVAGNREKLDVRFVLSAEELDRDNATLAAIDGDSVDRRWAEKWQFQRDFSVDTSASDEQHLLAFGNEEWCVAHRGWVVTSIERLPDGLPQPPQVQ